jgi:hypothetical protein
VAKEEFDFLLPTHATTIFVNSHSVISQQIRQFADFTAFHGFIQGLPYGSNLRAIQTGI